MSLKSFEQEIRPSLQSRKPVHIYAKQYTKNDTIISQRSRFPALLELVMKY